MKFEANNIPQELRNIPQWVGWKYVPSATPEDKARKVPINPHSGREARTNQRASWGTCEEAMDGAERFNLDGVGFVFTEDAGFAGIDFDDCIVDGKMMPEAEAAIRALNSYTEISPSGAGVKVIVGASKPMGAKCKVESALGCSQVEIYDRGRYFTVTGRRWPGTPPTVERRRAELAALCGKLWPVRSTKAPTVNPTSKPVVLGRDAKREQGGETVCQADTLSKTVSQGAGGVSGTCPTSRIGNKERCRRYLAKMPDAISGQGGHDATLLAACTCFRFGITDAEAAELMAWFNAEKCKPEWLESDLQHKLEDGKKKVIEAGEFGKMVKGPEVAKPSTCPPEKKKKWHNHLPHWIGELKLRPFQRILVQTLADKCDHTSLDNDGSLGGVFIGFDKLANECGMSNRTCKRHVAALCAIGVIVKVRTGGINFRTGEIYANAYAIPGKYGALDGVTE